MKNHSYTYKRYPISKKIFHHCFRFAKQKLHQSRNDETISDIKNNHMKPPGDETSKGGLMKTVN